MQEKKKVLMLGGTGAMGVYLAPELLNLGYQVYITSRSEHVSNERDIIYIVGNAKDPEFLDQLLQERYDAIVDFMVYNTKEFKARYMQLLDSTPHYLFLSSYRVYGDNHGQPITEESPRLLDSVDDADYLCSDEYGLTKARQENILRASGRRNWTILRPAITYSKERFQLGTMEANEFLQRVLKGKPIIFPKQMLDKQATMSWAGDVARLMARMVLNEEAMAETFTVSTSEHHTWREIMGYYTELLDMKVKLVDLAVYQEVIGRPYQIKYDRMLDRIIDNSKALRVAGMRQEDFMPLRDGLSIELTNFARNPKYTGNSPKRDRQMDALTRSRVREGLLKIKSKLRPIKNKIDKVKKLHQEKKLFNKIVSKCAALPLIRRLKEPAKKIVRLYQEEQLWQAIKKRVRKIFVKPIDLMVQTQKYDGAIVTLTGAYNYGSIIQRWALQDFLRQNGLRFKLLDFPFMQNMGSNVGDRTLTQKFIDRRLDTEEFDSEKAKYYRAFVVGSDQVWRDFFNDWKKFSVFFLAFLGEKKAKRIGYAISFGFDKWSGPYTKAVQKARISEYVKKFDAVSVREKSGIALVEELGNKAVHVLDPTLLREAADYSKLIEDSPYANIPSSQLFYYILDMQTAKQAVIDQVANALQMSVSGIVPSDGKPLVSPEVWLKGFRDAEFVITDSFHGMVFSIINRKNFYVFANKARGIARMAELLKLLGIENRIIYMEDIRIDNMHQSIDWKAVEKRLNKLKKESGEWLILNLK